MLAMQRLAGMSIAVVVALSFWAGDLTAGVIVPWAQERLVVDLDFNTDSAGSTSAPTPSSADVPEKKDSRSRRDDCEFAGNLEKANGGASTPTNGQTFQVSAGSAIVFSSPSIAPVQVAFEYLREREARLPQPPPGELLDPPKSY